MLFAGVEHERFYFVHSYAAHAWELPEPRGRSPSSRPRVTWATHGDRFVAAVENGPLSATQFHPEKSGDAGLAAGELGPPPRESSGAGGQAVPVALSARQTGADRAGARGRSDHPLSPRLNA